MVKTNKKLIIFDLDGTLLDTSCDLMNSMNEMLRSFGYGQISLNQAKQYIGNGARNFVLRSLPAEGKSKIEEALSIYNAIYNASGSPCTRLYDGLDEVLKELKWKGALLAIASNKPQHSTDEVYERYLKEYKFDYVYGNRNGFAHKPEKECGELILNELKMSAEDTLIVGDGETDVEFAHNLGSACIAVTWGYRSRKILEEAGVRAFANNPLELKEKIINFINGEYYERI